MNKEWLYQILETPSVSGQEYGLQKKIIRDMKEKTDLIKTDNTGNVYSILNENSPMKVLLAGHIDEIGLMVVGFTDNGMLKVMKSGGIRPENYLGQKVRVLTEKGVIYGAGAVGAEIWQKDKRSEDDILIDIGAQNKEEAMALVQHGDRVIVDTGVRELANDRITARAMDDRIGAYIVLEALLKAKEKGCKIGVCATTTVGEETSMRGAYAASMQYHPSFAIAVDVTFASDYSCAGTVYGDIALNKGPVLCHASYINDKLNQQLESAAKKADIAIQWEGAAGHTGTDADRIHFTHEGIPVALVSIPLRYMHSPAEVGSLNDIEACINLLAEFLCSLTEDFDFNPYH